jgi:AraC-like DNA-binding protein
MHLGVPAESSPALTVLALALRPRLRQLLRTTLPRRKFRVVTARTAAEFFAAFRRELVDAAVVDLGAPNDETPQIIESALEFPSIPHIGITPFRAEDASLVARCIKNDFAELLVDGVDDAIFRDVVVRLAFSNAFAEALFHPPESLGIEDDARLRAWRLLIAHGGRPLHTQQVAALLGISREHLSRTFSQAGAPNLKRIVDLVRLLAAAELAKNPGYDVGDIATVLQFASSSHLSTTAQRIVGVRPTSLARLRPVDLIERFVQGRSRSRPGKPLRATVRRIPEDPADTP